MAVLDIQDALALLEKREAREAAHLLEQMVAEMPAYATARVLLARSYEALNDWDRALAVWREVRQIIPNSPVVHQGLERAAARSAGRRSRGRMEEDSGAADVSKLSAPGTQVPAEEDPSGEAETGEPAPREMGPTQDTPAPTQDTPAPIQDTSPPAGDTPPPRAQDVSPPTHMPPGQHMPPPQHESGRPKEAVPPQEAPDDLSELQEVEDTGTPHYEDLDRLINELESARIVPRPDLEHVPSPDLEDDIEDVVSETLARIYASQGQYDEAARVYELLAGQHPEEADEYLHKASEMRSRASDGE